MNLENRSSKTRAMVDVQQFYPIFTLAIGSGTCNPIHTKGRGLVNLWCPKSHFHHLTEKSVLTLQLLIYIAPLCYVVFWISYSKQWLDLEPDLLYCSPSINRREKRSNDLLPTGERDGIDLTGTDVYLNILGHLLCSCEITSLDFASAYMKKTQCLECT